MKKISFVLIIAICLVSILTNYIFAEDNWSFDFFIDGTEINISSEEEITESFAYGIAHRIVFGDEGQAHINGLYCNMYGHSYVTTTATTITHRYYATAPRCLKEIYSVKTCSVCGHEIRTLESSTRIYCCN